jgi:hypothetical protein
MLTNIVTHRCCSVSNLVTIVSINIYQQFSYNFTNVSNHSSPIFPLVFPPRSACATVSSTPSTRSPAARSCARSAAEAAASAVAAPSPPLRRSQRWRRRSRSHLGFVPTKMVGVDGNFTVISGDFMVIFMMLVIWSGFLDGMRFVSGI